MLTRVLCMLACCLPGCRTVTTAPTAAPQAEQAAATSDPHSYARPDQVSVSHAQFELAVDFTRKQLTGSVTYTLKRRLPNAPLRLDTRSLDIANVWVGDRAGALRPAKWSAGESSPTFGTPLTVEIGPEVETVRVDYQTDPGATGLQWLEPKQTAGGNKPFLYSQSQAIHARSWFPCQDTPSVRMTFTANVRVPPGYTALMAAEHKPVPEPGVFGFSMEQAIPSYLVALAVGELEFAKLGPRSGVWAEPSVLTSATHEFADVEQMITAVESLYGPYRWGRYDLLVLPPAFPFGGMENPRLTFATPTILAGDRSLVALVAHELAHSWSGNLVTNASWGDLWLNEGFTVYVERRVVEALYGRERAEMEAMLGKQDLVRELAELPKDEQRLAVDLRGRDPDDGLTNVPYEKGALLLRALEETYGRERFDEFLRSWFDTHAFGSVNTESFVAFVNQRLLDVAQPLPGRSPVDVQAWIHEPGLANAPEPKSAALARVDTQLQAFVSGETQPSELETQDWSPHQWLHFMRALPHDPKRLATLDQAFNWTQSSNAELHAQWLEISVRAGYRVVDPAVRAFLRTIGRRKFLTPLYRALVESGREDEAREIYAQARAGYHAITRRTLDELVRSPKRRP